MTDGFAVRYDEDLDLGTIHFPDPNVAPVALQFQHGPIGENGINGIQNEEVLELIILRLGALDRRFPCDENKRAINYLGTARNVLLERTAKRRAQGVEGKNEAHVS